MRNRTGIEDWILEKAKFRREETNEIFLFPYDLGTWENIRQTFSWNNSSTTDGIYWPVRDECNQFSLTVNPTSQLFIIMLENSILYFLSYLLP